jgi:PAS domain S-box-containing protein
MILLAIEDITERRQAEQRESRLQQRRLVYLENLINTTREPLLVLNPNLQVVAANPPLCRLFGLSAEQIEDRFIYEIDGGRWDRPQLRQLLEETLPRENAVEDVELELPSSTGDRWRLRLNACRLLQETGRPELILLAIEKVAEEES